MKKLLILIPLFVSGCTASRVYTSGSSNYAPVNEKRGGTVKYQAGYNMTQRSDRERAYRMMFNECSGKYIITNEYDSSHSGTSVGLTSSVWVNQNIVWRYIDYQCVGN
jgi:hypothetical protein